jgi:hypothetical protein
MRNELLRELQAAWQSRRGVQAWVRGGQREFAGHYLSYAANRVRTVLANLHRLRGFLPDEVADDDSRSFGPCGVPKGWNRV